MRTVAWIFLIIGGLNWGSVGLLAADLVAALFGERSVLSRIIYTLVGLSALWAIYDFARMQGMGGMERRREPA
jgi:hypothetical protein